MDDRDKIRDFIDRVYAWLGASYSGRIEASPWPAIAVRSELRTLGAAAWEACLRDYPRSELQALASSLSGDALRRHGLYGAQLEYKLAAVEYAANRARRGPGVAGWLRKLLELIDNLLESILKALNVDDALKEIKDALLVSLPDEEDGEN